MSAQDAVRPSLISLHRWEAGCRPQLAQGLTSWKNGLTPVDRISSARKNDFLKQLEQVEGRYLQKSVQKQEKSFWVPLLSLLSVMIITFYIVSQFTT